MPIFERPSTQTIPITVNVPLTQPTPPINLPAPVRQPVQQPAQPVPAQMVGALNKALKPAPTIRRSFVVPVIPSDPVSSQP